MNCARRLPFAFLAFLMCLVPVAGALGASRPAPRVPRASGAGLGDAAAEPSAEPEGVARARRSIAEREYEVGRNAEGLQAPNRSQNLRSYFEPTGVRVVDRQEGARELGALRTERFGRGERLARVAPGEVRSHGRRAEILRPGLVEWFENGEAGLEHGYVVGARPEGEDALCFEVSTGAATARAVDGGVELTTVGGGRLRYGGLWAVDASGRELPARLEVEARLVRIEVEDAGASYPVTVDPLLTNTSDAVIESNQSPAVLGYSVASAGDVNGDGYSDVIVGAPFFDSGQENEGAAFVFLGGASGIASGSPATTSATLQSDQALAEFGFGVASAGDVNGDGYADVIVGAPFYHSGQDVEGAAFVFLGSASGVANGTPATASATLQSDQAGGRLGISVASAGDVNGDGYADVIVGAIGYSDGQSLEGAAFVFLGGASGIASGNAATASAILQSNQQSALLGYSVASAGDVNGDGYSDVIAGAPQYTSGETSEGAAFVFLGSASGIPSGNPTTASATLQSDQALARLGWSVASAGDVNGDGYSDVIVGAYWYDSGQTDEGAAFVFLGSASGIASGTPATASATIQSDQTDAQLGHSVASAGDVNGDGYSDVIIGANQYGSGQAEEGAAFVFLGGASGIPSGNPSTASATLQSDQALAHLGYSVASAGDVNGDGFADVIVGAPQYDSGQINEGAAFVSHGGARGLAAAGTPGNANTTLESNDAGAQLGYSVASAGDVNGDGYSDVIVGANQFDSGESNEGAAFVFLGGASGIASGNPATASTVLQSDQAFAYLGWSVASAGDVNGDGYGDVIVGALLYTLGKSTEGAAFVFLGSASGIASGTTATAAATLQSDQAGSLFGWSTASAGDVNGDGYADVIVGAPQYDRGQTSEGAAFVFLGGASGVASGNPATASATLQSDQAGAQLGWSASSAGDVNGDGFADVIVGAPQYDSGETDEGAAFVFLGGASGITSGNPSSAAATLQADQAGAQLGWSVASAGDVNGDAFADVIVSANKYDSGQTDEGAAFVFLGSASGIPSGNPATASATLQSDQSNANFHSSVASAGDVNGDGYSDVIVGSGDYTSGQSFEGAAFVFLGSASGVASGNPATASTTIQADQTAAQLGSSVASAGDVNGDGFADVIVGAYVYDSGQTNEGAAFVYYGNGGTTGRPVLPRQLRGDGSTPVQPWGLSYDEDSFQVRMTLTDPEGRGRVKLEVEACPAGSAFGDAGSCFTYVSPVWTDVTATGGGVTLTIPADGLAADTLYHWRARVLTAPFSVTAPGITAPPEPEHGPWRRLQGQAVPADIRTAEVACTGITCPADIAVSAGAGQCSAVVTFAPTADPSCGTVTCTPASGTAFAVGTTTVTCGTESGATCAFTVTVTDTQPPAIACPANVTVTANTPTGILVNYPAPAASDNCAGVTVACVPPSGSFFPSGASGQTTTVTCTATAANGQTAACAFTVRVNRPTFDLCAVSDENTTLDYFRANTATGYWEYRENGSCRVYYGTAETITRTSFFVTLRDIDGVVANATMTASFNLRTGLARVTVTPLGGGSQRVLTDYNYFNSACPPAGFQCVVRN